MWRLTSADKGRIDREALLGSNESNRTGSQSAAVSAELFHKSVTSKSEGDVQASVEQIIHILKPNLTRFYKRSPNLFKLEL